MVPYVISITNRKIIAFVCEKNENLKQDNHKIHFL
jgi:hypothetical protein